MKKSVALLTTALMATSFVFAATACNKSGDDSIFRGYNITQTTTKIAALTKDDEAMSEVDKLGLMLVSKENKEEDVVKSTTYKLFDVMTNAFVTGAEVTVDAETPQPTAEALTVTVNSPIEQLENEDEDLVAGFYYSMKVVGTFTADNLTQPQEVKTTYTLFGKNGKVATDLEGEFENNVFVAKDGTRYYVDIMGNLVKEENSLAKFIPYDGLNYGIERVGDYFISWEDESCYIYDKDGKYVRSWNESVGLNLPDDFIYGGYWNLGNYMFMQYAVALPETEDKYDFVDEDLVKYDLVTQRYDLETGKVKDFDMDFFVEDGYEERMFKDVVAVLYGQEIKDGRLMDVEIVQTFDEDCKVAFDVQKIVPGANELNYESGDYMSIYANGSSYIVEGDEVVFELTNEDASIVGNVVVLENEQNAWIKVYNMDGTLSKTYTDVQDVSNGVMGYMIQTETSIVKYDRFTNEVTTVCTFSKDAEVSMETLYVDVVEPGENTESEEDDKYSRYFLVPNVDNLLNLTKAEMEQYDVDFSNMYEFYGDTDSTMGMLFVIAKTTGEGESATTEVTYYNYKMTATME